MTIRRLTLLLALGALLAPAGASAQDEEGVFVDPDSPATREYSIPAEQARDQADPGRDDRVPAGGPTGSPAFGTGVGDGGGGSGSGGSGDGDGGDGDGGGSGGGGGSGDGDGGGGKASDRADAGGLDADAERILSAAGGQPVPDGGGGAMLAVLGGGALVVLAGVGGGALLRRRRGA